MDRGKSGHRDGMRIGQGASHRRLDDRLSPPYRPYPRLNIILAKGSQS
jgi:hypothetical protein